MIKTRRLKNIVIANVAIVAIRMGALDCILIDIYEMNTSSACKMSKC